MHARFTHWVARTVFLVLLAGGAHTAAASATETPPQASATPALRIYIARHGQTAWNAEHRLQGQNDIPLNDKGRQQAEALGELLRGVHLDGGESRTRFHERVERGLKRIIAAHPRGGTVLIVGHGGTNQQLLRSLLDLTDAQSQLIDQSNDEVYLVELATADSAARPPTLWKHVTREHLNEL